MRLNLDVRHLNLILAINETGTVSKASERLHLTQSALSHQLRDIEQKLGAPLFLRLKKRMVPTPAGERLLLSAQKLLGELKVIEEDIWELGANRGGVLRVSTECYTCYHWLPPLLKTFSKQYPNVSVQIVVEATQKPLQALLEGKIDLAIVSSEVEDSKFSVKPLFKDECVAIVSPEHTFASRRFLEPVDFIDANLFTYNFPESEITVLQRFLLPNGIRPKQISQVGLTEAMIEMVKAGLGMAVLARWAVRPHVEAGTVVAVPLSQRGLKRQWSAVMRKAPSSPKYLSEFADLLAQAIAAMEEKAG